MDPEETPPQQDTYCDKEEALIEELKERCKSAGIVVDIMEVRPHTGERWAKVKMTAGRDTIPIILYGSAMLSHFLDCDFEKYRPLGKYAAIYSTELGVIEACFGTPSLMIFQQDVLQASGTPSHEGESEDGEDEAVPELTVTNSSTGVRASFARGSKEIAGFLQKPFIKTTFKIEGLKINHYNEAVETLEKVANSLFFQIDMAYRIPVWLSASRAGRPLRVQIGRKESPPALEFPRTEYDRDPMSLYWYAKRAVGMPLLQFLAFYQTIEYYFPAYSKVEACRRIRSVIMDPTFRVDKDADIGRILGLIGASQTGYGDERSQLRNTLQQCIAPAPLRKFLSDDEDRAKFFAEKANGLTEKKLSFRSPDAELRNEVADRIYDIRCKIVHTKSGTNVDGIETLLPYSPQADMLGHDIDLIQYVAREVLIAASSPLRL